MEGFIVIDYMSKFPAAKKQPKQWIDEGKLIYKEGIQHGFENMPTTLTRLFTGENFGKQLLKVSDKKG